MTITYNSLKHSEHKMKVLLHGLSLPKSFSADHLKIWAEEPLHKVVVAILQGFTEHRSRIHTIVGSREAVKTKIRALSERGDLTKQQAGQLRDQYILEFNTLITAHKQELRSLREFLSSQECVLREELDAHEEKKAYDLMRLFKETLVQVSKELKHQGLHEELQDIKKKLKEEG